MDATVALGHRFVDAIVAHDWDAVASCFAPDARFLAVVANEEHPFREKSGGEAAAAQVARWFGDADVTELLAREVDPMVDRVRIMYRIHEHEPDGWYVVEQLAYVTPGDGGFARMNLACSGFRPVPD
ncbi:MAG: nuclear transport factor 2 family protein [Candidatus Limnocylindria bacterium]